MIDSARYLALLEEMTRQAAALSTALMNERAAMAEYDSSRIKQRLTEKLNALKALEDNIAQRQSLLSQAGLTPDADGHRALCETLKAPWLERISSAAQLAQDAIEQCQRHNQSNAAVLQRIKKKADAIKSIIAGGDGQMLYGSKGKTQSVRVGRALGSA